MSEEKQKVILAFDSSEQDDFSMCARRWHLIHHLDLRPITSVYALDRGSLLHIVLAEYYHQKMNNIADEVAIEAAIHKGRESSLEISDLAPSECVEVYFQFREYVRYWSEREESFYPVAIERSFVKRIYEDDSLILVLQGIIDYLGKYISADGYLVLDHKGMKQRTEYTRLRNQFKNYAIGAGVNTVIINKVGFQKTLPPADRFQRQTFTYYQDELEEQVECLIADGKKMLMHIQNDYYPPNFTSCDKWSGCAFRTEFCEVRPEARPYKIGTHFLVGSKWDVGKELEKTTNG